MSNIDYIASLIEKIKGHKVANTSQISSISREELLARAKILFDIAAKIDYLEDKSESKINKKTYQIITEDMPLHISNEELLAHRKLRTALLKLLNSRKIKKGSDEYLNILHEIADIDKELGCIEGHSSNGVGKNEAIAFHNYMYGLFKKSTRTRDCPDADQLKNLENEIVKAREKRKKEEPTVYRITNLKPIGSNKLKYILLNFSLNFRGSPTSEELKILRAEVVESKSKTQKERYLFLRRAKDVIGSRKFKRSLIKVEVEKQLVKRREDYIRTYKS